MGPPEAGRAVSTNEMDMGHIGLSLSNGKGNESKDAIAPAISAGFQA